jgi:hypothetical protein
MRGPTPRRLLDFVTRRLRLQRYLQDPGDGRPQPQIPAKALLWSMLIGQVLRACSFLAVERLVRSSARQALAVSESFSDDALEYCTERLDPTVTRVALAHVLHQAKRNKAFETSGGIGLAVDGSTVGWCASSGCSLCRSYRNKGIRTGQRLLRRAVELLGVRSSGSTACGICAAEHILRAAPRISLICFGR